MKINNFQGELTDISAKKAALNALLSGRHMLSSDLVLAVIFSLRFSYLFIFLKRIVKGSKYPNNI